MRAWSRGTSADAYATEIAGQARSVRFNAEGFAMSDPIIEINRKLSDVQSRASSIHHLVSKLTEPPRPSRDPAADNFIKGVVVKLRAHFEKQRTGQWPLDRYEFARSIYGHNLPT